MKVIKCVQQFIRINLFNIIEITTDYNFRNVEDSYYLSAHYLRVSNVFASRSKSKSFVTPKAMSWKEFYDETRHLFLGIEPIHSNILVAQKYL